MKMKNYHSKEGTDAKGIIPDEESSNISGL